MKFVLKKNTNIKILKHIKKYNNEMREAVYTCVELYNLQFHFYHFFKSFLKLSGKVYLQGKVPL